MLMAYHLSPNGEELGWNGEATERGAWESNPLTRTSSTDALRRAMEKACAIAQNPITQAITSQAAGMGPNYMQMTARGVQTANQACAMLQRQLATATGAAPGARPGAAPRAYPPGTITAFSRAIGKYRVAEPLMGVEIAGACVFGDCGLGQTHAETAPTATKPPGATEVSEEELDRNTKPTPWYKKWYTWVGFGAGALVLGGGAYLLLRR